MNEVARPILLDTNVALHLVRGNAIGQRIDERYGLRARADRPLVCVVTVGEARGLARYWNWGAAKTDALERLLRELVLVDISHHTVLEHYAEMHAFLVRGGRKLGDNDVWIAACTAAAGAALLTTDRDFEPLAERFIQLEWFDPRAGPR